MYDSAAATDRAPARPVGSLHELELGDPRWGSFVAGRPEATAFHDPAWTQLLAECYGHRPFVLAVIDREGTVKAGLPLIEAKTLARRRRWVSLPFSDTCEPLVTDRAAASSLVDGLERARIEAGIDGLEVRADIELPGAVHTSLALRHLVDLERDEEAVFRRLSRSQVQRNIARARNQGVVVRFAERRPDLDETFFALQVETRRRLGVPVQPRRFYSLLWERMIEPGRGFVLLAYAGTTPIAGAVFLRSPRILTYKFGASLQSHWRLRGNPLIFWTAIQQGCATGAEILDFGRTELRHESLRAFKRSWGTRELPLVHTFVGGGRQAPSRRATSALAVVIRHSPRFVCRALGATLYRYA